MNETEQQNRRAWYALAVLFGINLMNFFDRQILAAVTEPIRKEWNLSDTQMGLMGTAFILIYAVVGAVRRNRNSLPRGAMVSPQHTFIKPTTICRGQR